MRTYYKGKSLHPQAVPMRCEANFSRSELFPEGVSIPLENMDIKVCTVSTSISTKCDSNSKGVMGGVLQLWWVGWVYNNRSFTVPEEINKIMCLFNIWDIHFTTLLPDYPAHGFSKPFKIIHMCKSGSMKRKTYIYIYLHWYTSHFNNL